MDIGTTVREYSLVILFTFFVVVATLTAPTDLFTKIDPFEGQEVVGHTEPHEGAQLACPDEGAVDNETNETAIRSYSLTAKEVSWEFTAGGSIDGWTFNGAVPGPQLCANLGDWIEVTLTNEMSVPVSFHLHLPASENASFNPTEVAPGAVGIYYFEAEAAGTYLYHDLANGNEGVGRGLYGALIVRDSVPDVDHEIVVIMGEYQPDYHPGTYAGTINGMAFPWMPMWNFEQGERVRIHLLNAGPSEEHTFHVHGHRWLDSDEGRPIDNKFLSPHSAVYHPEVEAPEGFVGLSRALAVDVTTLDIVMEAAGEWMYHCHVYDHINAGMMGHLMVEEVEESGPGGGN
jgi:FtsP/CotA-like multicopper oxidase with cupredoxin domain